MQKLSRWKAGKALLRTDSKEGAAAWHGRRWLLGLSTGAALAAVILWLPLLDSCTPPRQVTIGFCVATMKEEIYSRIKQGLLDAAAGDNVDIIWVSAENNEARQQAQIQSLLARGVDVLAVQPVNTQSRRLSILEEVRRSGVRLIAVDRLPANRAVDLFISADNFAAGRLQAEYLVNLLHGRGNVAILQGDPDQSVSELITAGNLSVLTQYAGIRIVARSAIAHWSRHLAAIATNHWVETTGERLDAVLANNSNMAMGAMEVLERHGLGSRVLVLGADADQEACMALLRGRLTADIDKRPYEVGRRVYEVAEAMLAGTFRVQAFVENGPFRVPVYLNPVELVSLENVKEKLQERLGNLVFQLEFEKR